MADRLFLGGSLHGQFRDVESKTHRWHVVRADEEKPWLNDPGEEVGSQYRMESYDRRRVNLFGLRFDLFAPTGSALADVNALALEVLLSDAAKRALEPEVD